MMFERNHAVWIGLLAPLTFPLAFLVGASPSLFFFLALAIAAAMIFGSVPPEGQESIHFTGYDLLRIGGYVSGAMALCIAPDFVVQLLGLESPALSMVADIGWLVVSVLTVIYPFFSSFMGVKLIMLERGVKQPGRKASSATRSKEKPQ
jgi:hypothetical protein